MPVEIVSMERTILGAKKSGMRQKQRDVFNPLGLGVLMNHPLRLAVFTTFAVPVLAGLANAQTMPPAALPLAPAPPAITNFGTDNPSLWRAMNLARQAAEKANGGLEQYRAEAVMYGSTERAPLTVNPDGTWTFRFRGGPPGTDVPTVESIITVSRRGQVTLVANTPLVTPSPIPSTPEQPQP
jgi:hypothetical protein